MEAIGELAPTDGVVKSVVANESLPFSEVGDDIEASDPLTNRVSMLTDEICKGRGGRGGAGSSSESALLMDGFAVR